jgi:hypothetical protein
MSDIENERIRVEFLTDWKSYFTIVYQVGFRTNESCLEFFKYYLFRKKKSYEQISMNSGNKYSYLKLSPLIKLSGLNDEDSNSVMDCISLFNGIAYFTLNPQWTKIRLYMCVRIAGSYNSFKEEGEQHGDGDGDGDLIQIKYSASNSFVIPPKLGMYYLCANETSLITFISKKKSF